MAGENTPVKKANYDLAAKWMSVKVGKLVFDTSVSPHWLETSDKFWYTYETSQGRKFFIADPVIKIKKPIFDNAKMAAMLTKITLNPYDGQHLPIRTIKFIKKDTAIRFEIEYPKDAENQAVLDGLLATEKQWRKELGKEAAAGVVLGRADHWRRISETWPDPDLDDPELGTEMAMRLLDYIEALEPARGGPPG